MPGRSGSNVHSSRLPVRFLTSTPPTFLKGISLAIFIFLLVIVVPGSLSILEVSLEMRPYGQQGKNEVGICVFYKLFHLNQIFVFRIQSKYHLRYKKLK